MGLALILLTVFLFWLPAGYLGSRLFTSLFTHEWNPRLSAEGRFFFGLGVVGGYITLIWSVGTWLLLLICVFFGSLLTSR